MRSQSVPQVVVRRLDGQTRAASGMRLLAFMMTFVIACGGPSLDEDTRRSIVGDTIMVFNREPLTGDTATMRLVRRYGTFDDAGPSTLGEVFAIAVGARGDVYVYDLDQGIKQFSRDGSFDRWVARAGQGPREVGYTLGLAVRDDGTVAAYDSGNRRVVIWRGEEAIQTLHLPRAYRRYHEDALHFDRNGRLWLGVVPSLSVPAGSSAARVAYVRQDGGEWVDSLLVPTYLDSRCSERSTRRFRTGYWDDSRVPFIPKLTWARGADGTFVLGCPDRFEIDIHKEDGTVVRTTIPWNPLPLARAAKDYAERFRRQPPLPNHRPIFARIVVANDGRVWVWPNQPMEEWVPSPETREIYGISTAWRLRSSGVFEVFESDGRWRGTVAMPAASPYSGFPTERSLVIRGDTVWAVSKDSLDVNYVSRYQVVWPAP